MEPSSAEPVLLRDPLVVLLLQGPLSVFCARARWGPVHVICLRRREGGLGLTLRGDSPVLVAGVVPGGCAAVRGAATPRHATPFRRPG